MKFKLKYFLLGFFVFAAEVYIALFVKDQFVRPYFGDFLVVIMLYCFVRAFFRVSISAAAVAVLIFSYLIEFLQYLKIIEFLNLKKSTLATVIIGTSFEWLDIWLYTAGILFVLVMEWLRRKGKFRKSA